MSRDIATWGVSSDPKGAHLSVRECSTLDYGTGVYFVCSHFDLRRRSVLFSRALLFMGVHKLLNLVSLGVHPLHNRGCSRTDFCRCSHGGQWSGCIWGLSGYILSSWRLGHRFGGLGCAWRNLELAGVRLAFDNRCDGQDLLRGKLRVVSHAVSDCQILRDLRAGVRPLKWHDTM